MKSVVKIFVFAAVFMVALPLTTAPVSAADVGASISIGQPGFFGRIDIGNYRQPQVYYREPYWVDRRQVSPREPVYMRVPRGHRKNWGKHCGRYNACGERVYFVQDDWYENVYAPGYGGRHGNGRHDNQGRDYRGDRGNNGKHHGDRGNGKHKSKGRH